MVRTNPSMMMPLKSFNEWRSAAGWIRGHATPQNSFGITAGFRYQQEPNQIISSLGRSLSLTELVDLRPRREMQ